MKRAFTLVELLVTITIIGILAGMALGSVHYARKAAAEAKTKATIAKLNEIILRKYESYQTRRLPIDTSGKPPKIAAQMRLDAVRDLIRMEMPDSKSDIENPPVVFSWETPAQSSAREPAIHKVYKGRLPISEYDAAQALYLIVSMDNSESMEQFSHSEIGTVTDGKESRTVFIDGWDRPIMFLRWAPGFISDIQTRDAIKDHDPLDNRNLESDAFKLVPLIYSAGPDGVYGLDTQPGYTFKGNPFQDYPDMGKPNKGKAHADNIHNHRLEQN